jgi:uncharacterized protein YhjY with autotransporter beta-barrel domain
MIRQGFWVGLIGTALWFIAPTEAAAQQSCSVQSNGVYSCSIAAGSYSSEQTLNVSPDYTNPLDPTPVPPVSLTANGDITVAASSSQNSALSVSVQGGYDGSNPDIDLQDTSGLVITNTGSLTLTGSSPSSISSYIYGLKAEMIGGTSGDTYLPSQPLPQQLTVTNSGAIAINLKGVTTSGGSALLAEAAAGMDEGSSGGAAITNSGEIWAEVSTFTGYGGIEAVALGGVGGSLGSTVTSSAPVSVYAVWQAWGGQDNSGMYGVLAQSVGGNGPSIDGGPAQPGGDALSAAVTLTAGGDVTLEAYSTAPTSSNFDSPSAGVSAAIVGGDGGTGYGSESSYDAGEGGDVGKAEILVTDANVATSGDNLPGLLAFAQGGDGGDSVCGSRCDDYNGGAGGRGGDAGLAQDYAAYIDVSADTQPVTISTAGAGSAAVAALAQGGAGGAGGEGNENGFVIGGTGGNGGNIDRPIAINLYGSAQYPINLATSGDTSPGIEAHSIGGAGGDGGEANSPQTAIGGDGGDGGAGGDISIYLGSTAIMTSGATSPGILAVSEGSTGGQGGSAGGYDVSQSANGGAGGNAGNVAITLYSGASINTWGTDSSGIVAQSLSGAGGNSNWSVSETNGTGGNGGAGGNAGDVTVKNAGTISTTGATAQGILAQSISGGGGSGGASDGFVSGAGTGASSGTAGMVTVEHDGSITTSGAVAHGILAQSIGGLGGSGGQASGIFYSVGGSADTNPFKSDGGDVSLNADAGSITTSGLSAIGILGQSIGGGGGDGGSASGMNASVGGTGAGGGDGGTVSSTLDGTAITTYGDGAAALVLQSIGGGGGNAGNASATGPFVAMAVGGGCDDVGNCGGGGKGGSTIATLVDPTITTVGTKSPGLLVQSIGGGGGSGGNASAGSIGVGFSESAAVGGQGGAGGDGGQAQATVSGGTIATGQDPLLTGQSGSSWSGCTALPCSTLPTDSYGALVQSIGGGGGLGGSATAQAIAFQIPTGPEDPITLTVALSAVLGGKGGTAGDGGLAQFTLSDGGQIITNGQGSTGVLAQSIGGGGGAGGDSSAFALSVGTESGSTMSMTGSYAMGGSGGSGGDGGEVEVVLGDSTPDSYGNPTSIKTYGDYANGVVAQSIGGGGGNAGFGSSSSQAFSTTYSLNFNVTLGSSGGTGGEGGDVTVDLYAGDGITTYGSGAIGIMAQSVGGGGGASQGGSYGIGGGGGVGGANVSTSATVSVGTEGGSGGTGGGVTVSAQAPITTHGGDATGILAQSVGGGGGVGGSAGSDASADNPVLQGLDARQATSNWKSFFEENDDGDDGENNGSWAANLTTSVGGKGGTGGDGGTVWTALYAPVTTTGDWAKGIVAQSIGGGGGMGGSAAASGTGGYSYVTVNADIAIGGQGGSAGAGGDVTVELDQGNQGGSWDNNTSIRTAGFGAAGVIAQSVGGGGGIGGDGSDSAAGTLSVGGGAYGNGGAAGEGGTVLVSYYNPDSTAIVTTGDVADGVILQSIGGGGGMAGAGSSLFVAAFQQSAKLELSAGGGEGSSGAGGAVSFAPSSDSDTPITILTTGTGSFGLLAQSIGGGGGIVTSQPSSSTSTTLIIGGDARDNEPGDNGGAVSVTLGSQGTIATMGIGAHGIVAQSIGGGGGVVRLVNQSGDSPTLDASVPSNLSNAPAVGDGGTVDVEVGGMVNVAGPGAVGILAQSVGSGGGLVMSGNNFYAGSPNNGDDNPNAKNSSGYGGDVTVMANGTVTASGANGIGIFAQSTGAIDPDNGQVSVTVNGSVTGGSGQAATSDSSGNSTQLGSSAIQVDSRAGSNNGVGNVVTVNAGGSLNTISGTDGTAIVQTGGGTTNVTNAGTVTGATYLGGGTFTNTNSGVHNTGSVTEGDVVNHGAVNIGLPSEVRVTRITGDFTQTSTGQLGVTIHSLLKTADYLQVDGTASIDGVIVPRAITLLPGTVPVVTAGTLVSTADALDSLLFRWDATQSGNTLSITPSSNFTPAGVRLNRSQASLANYFSQAWANADAAFATQFAYLSQIASPQDYAAALNAFSGQDIQAQSIAFANTAGAILGAPLSCPVFVDRGVLLGEDNCAWATISGRWTNQGTTNSIQGYDVTTTSYRIGGQHEIAPNWYLGGSLAYGDTSATMNGDSRGDGYTVDGSVALKRTIGPWYFAGSAALAYGSFDTYRQINLPGVTETLESKPSIFLAGARLRAGYEFTFGDLYVRPYGDFDVIHTNLPAARESGSSIYALDVQGSSKTSVALSAMMEVGGRVKLDEQTTLRPYASFGVSYLPDNTRAIGASFGNESINNGTFFDYIETPEFLGRIDLGLQIYRVEDFELKVGYTADIGTSYLSQSATARFAYHF